MFRVKSVIVGILSLSVVLPVSAANDDFRAWMQEQQQTFQEYKDARDKEFTNFLKAQWKEMEVFSGIKRDETPKPVKMPVAKPRPKPRPAPVVKQPPPKPVPGKTPSQSPYKQPPVKAPVKRLPPKPVQVKRPPVVPPKPEVPVIPPVSVPKGKQANLYFYGNKMTFYYDPRFITRVAGRVNKDSISKFWSDLSKSDYDDLLAELNAERGPLQLNDWGFALLINKLGEKIYPRQQNEKTLFTWFMLIKAGYQARLAYGNQAYLLLPTRQRLYSVAYFTFDGKRYYVLGLDGKKAKPGKVFTYDGQYPGATKQFNMSLDKTLNTQRDTKGRKVRFSYGGKSYSVTVRHDNNTIAFLRTYPQMDIGEYFKSRVNEDIGNPLLVQLRTIITGKSEEEAVNILLRFVQNAFKYKTDEGQFGEENYLFPEETMFYPYSDCEDRSVIFAWLVRSLLDLEVVGLDFPGHIAAAVNFRTANVSGDAVSYKGKRFVVTDPTYINAVAGMTMPDFKRTRPGVISFKAY